MKWFNRWFYKKCKEVWENRGRYDDSDDHVIPVAKLHSRGIGQNPDDVGVLNFKIYSASGGKIVEVMGYDSKTDMDRVQRYVIPDDEDFTACLNRIVTMEHLTR